MDIKLHFEKLTMVEEMLISPVQPIMSIYRLPGGQLVSRGYVANFSQNLDVLCKELPRIPADISVIILKKDGQCNNNKEFKVNRARVLACLAYLCELNPQYKAHGIKISMSNVDNLPDFKTVIVGGNDVKRETQLPVDDDIIKNETELLVDEENDTYQAYIETEIEDLLEVDKINVKLNWPITNPVPLVEFNFDGICALAFPKLFILGKGDPTKKARLAFVSETDGFKHLLKFACKNSMNEYYYPFATHPRFKFYAYDRLRRHRALDQ